MAGSFDYSLSGELLKLNIGSENLCPGRPLGGTVPLHTGAVPLLRNMDHLQWLQVGTEVLPPQEQEGVGIEEEVTSNKNRKEISNFCF